MYLPLYVEINVLCILILTFILYKNSRVSGRQIENVRFSKVILYVILILEADMFWALIEEDYMPSFYSARFFINSTYMFLTGLISLAWLKYTECKLGIGSGKRQLLSYILYRLPLLVLGIMCYSSQLTHLIFYIDSDGKYVRGDGYILQLIIAYGYLIAAAIETVYAYCTVRSDIKRKELRVLLSFFVLPAIGGIFEAFNYGIPTSWPGATLSLLLVYINFQDSQISTDGLTGLNNRRNLDLFLSKKTVNRQRNVHLYLFLIDINHFKRVNDIHGHYEGDNALIEVANVLRRVCDTYDVFLSRYGGDEFAIVYECDDGADPENVKDEILRQIDVLNKSKKLNFGLSVSIGYSEYPTGEAANVPSFIAAADKKLYADKKRYHNDENRRLVEISGKKIK